MRRECIEVTNVHLRAFSSFYPLRPEKNEFDFGGFITRRFILVVVDRK